MSYTIKIGNRAKTSGEYEVEDVEHPDAPADGVPTDFTNSRWPSYTGWEYFTEQTGLHELFFHKKRGLMRKHPGIYPIKQEHVDEVMSVIVSRAGTQKNQIIWLQYWMKWAIENCERPYFQNT